MMPPSNPTTTAENIMKQTATSTTVPVLAFSVEDFCQAHAMSRFTFYRLQKNGRGPRVMRVDGRQRISVEAAADWRRQMEEAGQGKAA